MKRLTDEHLEQIQRRHVNGFGADGLLYDDVGSLLDEVHRVRAKLGRVRADNDYLRQHVGNAVAVLAGVRR
jgi:hypothetical protein